MAGLVALMAALSAAGITMHNAAYIAERRHATASSCRMGADILTIGPMVARQRTLASCRAPPADQAAPARMIPLMEQKTAILLAAPLGAGSVAFSPDGKLLASAYSDGIIRLWNPVTGRAAGSLPRTGTGGQSGAVSVAFSPDSKLLASAYSNGTIRLWNLATGQPAGTASGGWLVTAAAVIAIAVSMLAAAITTREIHFSSRRILRPGSKLWKYC
jgi:hypothetical protein